MKDKTRPFSKTKVNIESKIQWIIDNQELWKDTEWDLYYKMNSDGQQVWCNIVNKMKNENIVSLKTNNRDVPIYKYILEAKKRLYAEN